VLWTFLAFGIGAGASWYYREAIFAFLLEPAGGQLSPFDGLPVYNSPVAMMSATIQLAMRGGAIVALLVLMVSAYTLVKPLIPPQQRRFLIIFMPVTVVCFLCGAAFAYYVMLPTGLKFLLNFGDGVAVPMIVISEYINLLTALMFWLGVVFELPLIMYALARMRLVSYLRFRNLRKYVPVTAFILSAILTPTFDVVNQTLLAVPIILLYEVGLFLSWVAWPEQGNYMFIKTIGRWLRRVRSVVARLLRKVRSGLCWLLRQPVVGSRWTYWKARYWIWDYWYGL
jgi:sec-independent protein translocase protein TatC|tara:strand:+ start:1230 stop:2081 length:852 start_codon:yes stop_codon:yes gene_type:complete